MTRERGRTAETSTAAPERIELTGLFAMLLGVWYPRNYILAAIDPTDGAAAVKALLAAGFGSNSVRLEDSAGVRKIRAAIYEQRGSGGREQRRPARTPLRSSRHVCMMIII